MWMFEECFRFSWFLLRPARVLVPFTWNITMTNEFSPEKNGKKCLLSVLGGKVGRSALRYMCGGKLTWCGKKEGKKMKKFPRRRHTIEERSGNPWKTNFPLFFSLLPLHSSSSFCQFIASYLDSDTMEMSSGNSEVFAKLVKETVKRFKQFPSS